MAREGRPYGPSRRTSKSLLGLPAPERDICVLFLCGVPSESCRGICTLFRVLVCVSLAPLPLPLMKPFSCIGSDLDESWRASSGSRCGGLICSEGRAAAASKGPSWRWSKSCCLGSSSMVAVGRVCSKEEKMRPSKSKKSCCRVKEAKYVLVTASMLPMGVVQCAVHGTGTHGARWIDAMQELRPEGVQQDDVR